MIRLLNLNQKEPDEKIRRLMEEAGWDKMDEEELSQALVTQLELMIKQGEIEQLVGEDGEFYYRAKKNE